MICVPYNIFFPFFLFVWGFIKPILNWFTFNKAAENFGEVNGIIENNDDNNNGEINYNEANAIVVNDMEVGNNEFIDPGYYDSDVILNNDGDEDNDDDNDGDDNENGGDDNDKDGDDNDEKLSQISSFSCIYTNKQLPRDPTNNIQEIETLLKDLIEASYTNKKCV